MPKFKIVTDSSSDLRAIDGVSFASAPLKIVTSEKEYVDDTELDVEAMVRELSAYRGRSSTSCPNVADWIAAFGDAEEIFCITITGTLSGAYSSATVAAREYQAEHPERRVCVIDSLSTGPEMALIADKIAELHKSGKSFEEIEREAEEYRRRTGLLFVLESMKNLANNGRVSPLAAKAAGLLGIRVIGKASDKGDLEPLHKVRGEGRTLDTVVECLRELGYGAGRIKIAHCMNIAAAEGLRDRIAAAFDGVKAEIYSCGALCSFYAERGGLLIGFEK